MLFKHDNLILKLHQKKNSHLDEGWLFIGSFKVGSVPGMISKEVLAQFIYKPTKSTAKLFIWGNLGKLSLNMHNIEERGWVNAQILLTNQ